MSKNIKYIKFAQSVQINNSQQNSVSPSTMAKMGGTVELHDDHVIVNERNGEKTKIFASNIAYIKYMKEEPVPVEEKSLKAALAKAPKIKD